MNIDAKTMHHTEYRPYTAIGAVARVIDGLEVGSSIDVSGFVDVVGRSLPASRLSMYVSRVSGDRKFTVRTRNTEYAVIHRIA